MRAVSEAFAPYADERAVDVKINFELLDEGAADAAEASASEQESLSQLDQLTDGVTAMGAKYATLEPDSWLLGGGYQIMPDDVSGVQTGWWGTTLSDETGAFDTAPSLSFSFGGDSVDTIGYMLYFDAMADSWPTSIKVTAYDSDGATVLAQETHANSSANCTINMPVRGYYSVTFEFLATSKPQRRVRLAEVLFGIVQTFDRDNLTSVKWSYAADITAAAFSSWQVEFVFENLDHKYNLVNPDGLYAYLQEGQDIHAAISMGGEAVDMGAAAFSSASADDTGLTGTITANDPVLLSLDEAVYSGGSDTTATLSDAVAAVLGDLDITVDLEYPDTVVSLALPADTTKREALRLLAQAACCSVWFDRDGVLQMHPLTVGTAVDTLDGGNCPTLGGISVSEPVDSVELTAKNEYAGTETVYTSGSGKRVKTISNPAVAAANGQTVADWLLEQYNRRVQYSRTSRGNPAVEIADTLTIHDAYGGSGDAAVTGLEITYDGGLSSVTKAVGA